ncbi:thermonuclease family protein [Sediminivirga luteola]|uniref:TNase-like domain-containing protein n=1 Tax=Sediminivirga luteola TaxID=1774748 RepID=A0A8J2U0F6_9MICO|nr:thermonuclease family protein [Sediminivirga luteola]GGA24500.1 hypothetical protein GCM10011333_29410 [Sediminivirga luteola]
MTVRRTQALPAPAVTCLAVILGVLLGGCQVPGGAGERPSAVPVVAIVDGDTIRVDLGGETERVRLLGIDTPELGRGGTADEPCAVEARERLAELIGDQIVLVPDPAQGDRDRYGRLLRYADTPEGVDAGLVLVAEGLADLYWAADDITRWDDYLRAYDEAPAPACAG